MGRTYEYKVLRTCYWNNILWNPDETPTVKLDPGLGIPPHHFEPLDGGPVEPTPTGAGNGPTRVDLPPVQEPRTLGELQRATAGQEAAMIEARTGADAIGGPRRGRPPKAIG
jgi:hypothetical protein